MFQSLEVVFHSSLTESLLVFGEGIEPQEFCRRTVKVIPKTMPKENKFTDVHLPRVVIFTPREGIGLQD